MKKLTVVFSLICFCSLAYGQKTANPQPPKARSAPQAQSERPSAEQVIKLLDLMQIRDSLQLTLDTMKTQMKSEAEAMFRQSVPVPTVDELKSINNIVNEAFAEISMDDLIRDVVPVYQKHLSRADVAALITFYSSPVGQRLRREQPAMMRETMEATSAGQQQKMESLLRKIDVRMEQLIQTDQRK